jgi:flagellar basal-body rod protein FlgC
MSGINDIAGSALQAFSVGQQVTANNVANMNTDGFTASKATFQEVAGGGVNAAVSKTEDTVDLSREAENLRSNATGFKANLKVLKTADEMTKELFSIKA